MPTPVETCFFCGSTKPRLTRIGIALGMGGDDYNFCGDCLERMSADEFWRELFQRLNLQYPVRRRPRRGLRAV